MLQCTAMHMFGCRLLTAAVYDYCTRNISETSQKEPQVAGLLVCVLTSTQQTLSTALSW